MTPKKQLYTEIVSNNTLISWKSILLRHTVESLFATDSRAQNKKKSSHFSCRSENNDHSFVMVALRIFKKNFNG